MITTIKSSRNALIVVSFEHSQVWLFNLNPITRRSSNVIHSRAYILFALFLFCQPGQFYLVRETRCEICMRLYYIFNMMRKPNEIHTHTPKLILAIQYAARWTLSCENQKAIKISLRARKKCDAVKIYWCNSFICMRVSIVIHNLIRKRLVWVSNVFDAVSAVTTSRVYSFRRFDDSFSFGLLIHFPVCICLDHKPSNTHCNKNDDKGSGFHENANKKQISSSFVVIAVTLTSNKTVLLQRSLRNFWFGYEKKS